MRDGDGDRPDLRCYDLVVFLLQPGDFLAKIWWFSCYNLVIFLRFCIGQRF
jgi:hypothetical protein